MSAETETDSTTMADRAIPVGVGADDRAFELPVEEVLTGRGAILGKSGSGKSNSASVLAEQLLERGLPLLIVDTDGEYYGLKEQFERLHAGADEECDIQVGPEHAERLAELALEEHVPIILDVSAYLDEDEASELIRETARHLFAKEKKRKHPFLLVVEEIHEYIPEGGGLDDTGQMLVKVAKRGRKHGLGIVGISQRPADVKKDFITQANWLVWHRLTWENDTKVVRRVAGSDVADGVTGLADGEAFVQLDWAEADVERVQFDRKQTFDAGATPGLDEFERPELKSVSEDLLGDLEDISERADRRRDEIERLQEVIDEKDERIEELERELENQENIAEAAQQMANALSGDNGDDVPEDFDEQLTEKNERIHDLEATLEAKEERIDDLEEEVERARVNAERVEEAERIEERFDAISEHVEALAEDLELDIDISRSGATPTGDATAETPSEKTTSPESNEEQHEMQERISELEAENERLRARLEEADGVTVPTDYQDFVNEDVVQEAIEEAKEKSNASQRYVKGVVAAIIQEGGPVDYQTVADRLGVSDTSNISKAASTLEALGVLERVQQSPARVDFDLEGIAKIKEQQQRRRQAEAVMDDL